MNKAQAEIAVKALRSGEYTQVRASIGTYMTNNLCCIGVAAKANGAGYFETTDDAADFIHLKEKEQLISMNDSGGKSFAEIADWIEGQTWDEN